MISDSTEKVIGHIKNAIAENISDPPNESYTMTIGPYKLSGSGGTIVGIRYDTDGTIHAILENGTTFELEVDDNDNVNVSVISSEILPLIPLQTALVPAEDEDFLPTKNKTIETMVANFLKWELPEDFSPDGGITFSKSDSMPVGTNLLTYEQAKNMIEFITKGVLK
jgi:hypothetical protein